MTTAIQPPELSIQVEAMRRRDGRIHSYVLSSLLEKVAQHAGEMSMPVVDVLARNLEAGGHDRDHPFLADDKAVWAEKTPHPFFRTIAIHDRSSGASHVLTIEVDGKVDPKMEEILSGAISGYVRAEQAERPAPDARIVSLALHRFEEDPTSVIQAAVEDRWDSELVLKARSSLRMPDGTWFPSTRSGSLENVLSAFETLDDVAFGPEGPLDASDRLPLEEGLRAYRRRRFLDAGADSPSLAAYSSAFAAATIVRDMDDHLPARKAREAMKDIHGRVAETDMDALLPMLEDVHRMARDGGHVDEESEFDFNDMDDFAFAVAGEEDALYLRCQNTVHAVRMSP